MQFLVGDRNMRLGTARQLPRGDAVKHGTKGMGPQLLLAPSLPGPRSNKLAAQGVIFGGRRSAFERSVPANPGVFVIIM